jgi:uncharacterized lipoprotein YajG
MRTLAILAALVLLSGCSTLSQLENRVACTPDGKQMVYVSMYGPIGVASRISETDAQAICKPMKG